MKNFYSNRFLYLFFVAFCSSAFGQVDNKPDKTPPSEKTPVTEKAGERLIDDGKIKSVIEDLLGETLDGYKDFGFKDVTLGSDLSKMRDSHTLNWASEKGSIEFMDSNTFTSNRYIFNGRNKLVCYTKILKGGLNDYAERIIEIFGKTNQKIEDDVIRYTFEKTLVSVHSRSLGDTRNLQRVTVITIWDKKWMEEVLLEYAVNASELLAWQKKTTTLIKNKDVDFNTILKLPGTSIVPNEKFKENKVFNLIYPKTSKCEEFVLGTFGYFLPPEESTNDPDEKFKKFPIINIGTKTRLNSTPLNSLYEVKKFDDDTSDSNFAALTIKTKYTSDLLLWLVQMHYPPKTNKIEVITPRYGNIIRQWNTKDGWHVQVRNDIVFLTFFGVKNDL